MSGDEIAAPPTALQAKDLKSGYNVTTPAQVWLYWNTLQHQRSAAEVLSIALKIAREAMRNAIEQLDRHARRLKQSALAGEAPVITYAELVAGLDMNALGAELALSDLDLPTRSLRLTEEAWRLSGRAGPAVIIGYGSIPYQAVTLDDDGLRRRLIAAAAPDLNPIGYFPGISDMSFLGRGNGGFEIGRGEYADLGDQFQARPLARLPNRQYRAMGPRLSSLARTAQCALCL